VSEKLFISIEELGERRALLKISTVVLRKMGMKV
jgi:hypothetical protein